MGSKRVSLEDVRSFYAEMMAAASGAADPRLRRIFEAVPREAFLPPGPWTIMVGRKRAVQTPTADPVHLYQNVLVALDLAQGINNGEPLLHAAWLGEVAPQPGEIVTHIGAGTGYYTAILSMLVLPAGPVTAFEIHEELAEAARRNLRPFENVAVICGNAVEMDVPSSDLIYVNAGVVAPPKQWITALRPGGRMIFPWRPTEKIGLAGIITHTRAGYEFKPLMHAWFVPCVGASTEFSTTVAPDYGGAWRSRSVRFTSEQAPDQSATAIYEDLWFSDQPPEADHSL